MGLIGRLFLGGWHAAPRAARDPGLRDPRPDRGESARERPLRQHFRAPGRRFHGKVTPVRVALAISKQRVVAYAGSGRAKLVDSPFTSPHFDMVEVRAVDGRVELLVDYDRGMDRKISGRVLIRIHSPDAERIVRELQSPDRALRRAGRNHCGVPASLRRAARSASSVAAVKTGSLAAEQPNLGRRERGRHERALAAVAAAAVDETEASAACWAVASGTGTRPRRRRPGRP